MTSRGECAPTSPKRRATCCAARTSGRCCSFRGRTTRSWNPMASAATACGDRPFRSTRPIVSCSPRVPPAESWRMSDRMSSRSAAPTSRPGSSSALAGCTAPRPSGSTMQTCRALWPRDRNANRPRGGSLPGPLAGTRGALRPRWTARSWRPTSRGATSSASASPTSRTCHWASTSISSILRATRRSRASAPGLALPDGPVALYVGRFAPEKHAGWLAREWGEVYRRTGVTLVMVGEGSLRPRIEALAGPGLVVLGYTRTRETVADLHAAADFYVSPCPYETFGLAALEALASGTPVLSADDGGVSEQVAAVGGGLPVPLRGAGRTASRCRADDGGRSRRTRPPRPRACGAGTQLGPRVRPHLRCLRGVAPPVTLLVSIHDVAPPHLPAVRRLWLMCRDAGVVPALLVVPDWHGSAPIERDPDLHCVAA